MIDRQSRDKVLKLLTAYMGGKKRMQSLERPLLLGSAAGWKEPAAGDGDAFRAIRCRQERIALSVRNQFQRSSELAETRRRVVLGIIPERSHKPKDRRTGHSNTPPDCS